MSDVIKLGPAAKKQLAGFVSRVTTLEEERQAIGDDLKQVLAEAEAAGFDKKVIRRIVRDERKGRDDVANFEAALDLYRDALGIAPTLGLAQATRQELAKRVGEREERKADRADGSESTH